MAVEDKYTNTESSAKHPSFPNSQLASLHRQLSENDKKNCDKNQIK